MPGTDTHGTPAPGPTARGAGPATGAIVTVIILGSLMPVLDMTIVNVALNSLARSFDAPLATIQWVVTGYALALAAVMPVTAWAIGRFGGKRVYLTAIALFTLGSALAGAAWSAPSLIAFRVVQGLGGGMIVPTGMALVLRSADRERLGRTMSLLGIPVLIGPLAGPILGGWLVEGLSWRWLFFINVPLGALTMALAALLFPRVFPGEAAAKDAAGKGPGGTGAGGTAVGGKGAGRLDVPGLLMLSPGLASLLYGLTRVEGGSPAEPAVWLPVVAGAALIGGFVRRALTARSPLLDLRLFRHRPFAVSAGALTLFTAGYFGTMVLTPLYFQALHGESVLASGLLAAPQALVTGITMQLTGRFLTDRLAPRQIILPGILLAGTGMTAFAVQAGPGTPHWRVIAALALVGIGVGMTMMTSMTTATRTLPAERSAEASTTLNITSQMANSVGTAALSVLLAAQIAGRVPGSGGTTTVLDHAPAGRHAEIAGQLGGAFRTSYALGAALMLAAALPALLHSRRRPADTGTDTGTDTGRDTGLPDAPTGTDARTDATSTGPARPTGPVPPEVVNAD